MQAGGNVRMSVGGDVWIDAQSHARDLAQAGGTLGEGPEFRFAFYIEEKNSGFQCSRHFIARFSYSRENDFLRCLPVHFENALQFSSRNYIEAASLARQQSQNA